MPESAWADDARDRRSLPDLRDVTDVRSGWDVRVVYSTRHSRYFWNAWDESSATELHGFEDTHEEASEAALAAIHSAVETVVHRP